MKELASIIIVTYNHKNYLADCLHSLSLQNYPHEIILVDNGSDDGTIPFVQKNFPYVKVIKNVNTGYGAGNNTGVAKAVGTYIVILNPDTIVEEDWLENLIEPLKDRNKNLVTTSKILMYDGLSINTCGNLNHFTGMTFTNGLKENLLQYNRFFSPTGISGACFAMRKEDYVKIGGFDENFFLYNEDSEFSWRLHFYGYSILFVPTSIVRHDYDLKVPPEKLYHLESGRYKILCKYYTKTDLVQLLPSMLATEFLVFAYAVKNGYRGLFYKIRSLKSLRFASGKNTYNQKSGKILKNLSPVIPLNQLTSNQSEKLVISLCNKIYQWNLKVIKKSP
jgi:GT2 family glycosyltransferase